MPNAAIASTTRPDIACRALFIHHHRQGHPQTIPLEESIAALPAMDSFPGMGVRIIDRFE